MSTLRLAVFDVDGTLADSQGEIAGAMHAAFASEALAPPSRAQILAIIGLSLDEAMLTLAPDQDAPCRARLVGAYRHAYSTQRRQNGVSPLYPGAVAALEALAGDPFLLMGVATGKSKRGVDALIEAHGLERFFVTRQAADFHPSKPHPAMLLAALDEAGVTPGNAVMIGDTRFDMDMARNAGVASLGVSWGYHPAETLDADYLAADFADVPGMVAGLLGCSRENR
ncbi:HAD-IA family hydrolase [Aquicoccus sp. G2-2]|uniref:HAD-IA family hydrolase n=1 Tax=Aquicoccus sp. G2-2 TaxID=3092120 RepID=UPI002AE08233|nr:HAD-IA family hydrolase [Aquicoccus sp. G2-2]MEA1113763.1 HAD-IA family hydrolase [Aquicoccus sp. G2-2]